FVEEMAALTVKHELDVPVTVSHAVAMAYYNHSYLAKLTQKLIDAPVRRAHRSQRHCATGNVELMARIIVIGGHGKVALQLSPVLAGRGDDVTSVFRNPDHSEEVAVTGAAPVVADIEQLGTDGLTEL